MPYKTKRYKKNRRSWPLAATGILFLAAALILGLFDLANFQKRPSVYPTDQLVAGIPVGGLSESEAVARLEIVFNTPIELRLGESRLQFLPSTLGFKPDFTATMRQVAENNSKQTWQNWLFKRDTNISSQPQSLLYSLDENQKRSTLMEALNNRYTYPASHVLPVLYSTNVQPGSEGFELSSTEDALRDISAALLSPSNRVVDISLQRMPAQSISWQNLEVMLKQTILQEKFNGLAEIYLHDLRDQNTMHIAVVNNQPVTPDAAYSAASTIKIPIMLATFKRLEEPLPERALSWMSQMISESLNPPADGLMKQYIDNNRGPMYVTEDLRELGYQNTFMAGYFEPGSPLLERITTPANSRTDIFLDPDFYNQTVPSEIGDLLTRIYSCSQSNDPSAGLFSGLVTPSECQMMLDLLAENKIGALIEAGLPNQASTAHKHGWTVEIDGLLHSISDSAIVYTPAADYVLVIFIHSTDQLLFDKGNVLFAKLSQSIYNAYNPTQQTFWYSN